MFSCNTLSAQAGECVQVSSFCEFVHYRYHFIKRLQRMLDLLRTNIATKPSVVGHLTENHCLRAHYQHPHIKRTVERIFERKSLSPLLDMWDDFFLQKHIYDEALLQEFTRLILDLSVAIYTNFSVRSNNPIEVTEVEKVLSEPATHQLRYINYFEDLLFEKEYQPLKETVFDDLKHNTRSPLYDVPEPLPGYSENVLDRFYEHQACYKARELLNVIKQHPHHALMPFESQSSLSPELFCHPCSQALAISIASARTFQPVELLIKFFDEYRHAETDRFSLDVLRVYIYLFSNYLVNHHHVSPQSIQPFFVYNPSDTNTTLLAKLWKLTKTTQHLESAQIASSSWLGWITSLFSRR